ncbi:hypothetical protein HOF51_01315 [bacterium]|jgi:hypothetical protein|nr:hypothetical protein [bacterium]
MGHINKAFRAFTFFLSIFAFLHTHSMYKSTSRLLQIDLQQYFCEKRYQRKDLKKNLRAKSRQQKELRKLQHQTARLARIQNLQNIQKNVNSLPQKLTGTGFTLSNDRKSICAPRRAIQKGYDYFKENPLCYHDNSKIIVDLEHVFGFAWKNDCIHGGHFDPQNRLKKAAVLKTTNEQANPNQAYTAQAELPGITRSCKKSFFPPTWRPEQVCSSLKGALKNPINEIKREKSALVIAGKDLVSNLKLIIYANKKDCGQLNIVSFFPNV